MKIKMIDNWYIIVTNLLIIPLAVRFISIIYAKYYNYYYYSMCNLTECCSICLVAMTVFDFLYYYWLWTDFIEACAVWFLVEWWESWEYRHNIIFNWNFLKRNIVQDWIRKSEPSEPPFTGILVEKKWVPQMERG